MGVGMIWVAYGLISIMAIIAIIEQAQKYKDKDK